MDLAGCFVSSCDYDNHALRAEVVEGEFKRARIIVASDVVSEAQTDYEPHLQCLRPIHEILQAIDDLIVIKGPTIAATYWRPALHNY